MIDPVAPLQGAASAPGPMLEDPGLTPWIPAIAFILLAAIVWFIWRRLAD